MPEERREGQGAGDGHLEALGMEGEGREAGEAREESEALGRWLDDDRCAHGERGRDAPAAAHGRDGVSERVGGEVSEDFDEEVAGQRVDRRGERSGEGRRGGHVAPTGYADTHT